MRPKTSTTKAPSLRRVVAAAVAALTCWGVLAGAPAAQAAPKAQIGFKVSLPKYPAAGSGLIGTMAPRKESGKHRVICIGSMLAAPSGIKKTETKSSAKLGYLLGQYVDTADPVTAAALATIVKDQLDVKKNLWAEEKAAFKSQHRDAFNATQAKVKAMTSEASKYQGPYGIKLGDVEAEDLVKAPVRTVTNIGVLTRYDKKTRTGKHFLPGVKMTLTVTGGVFVDNGAAKLTLTSAKQAKTVQVRWDGTSEQMDVLASVGKDVLPGTKYTRLVPSQASAQPLVTALVTKTSGTASDPLHFFFDSRPVLTSKVSDTYVAADSTLGDRVELVGGLPDTTVRIATTVYGPLAAQPAPSDTVPAQTAVFEQLSAQDVTLDGAGKGSATFATTKKATEPGFYVWVERIEASEPYDAQTSSFGRPAETTLIQAPKVVSTASAAKTSVGKAVSDKVVLSGMASVDGAEAVTRTGTVRVLGPVHPQADQTCSAITAAQWADAPVAKTWAFNESQNKAYNGLGSFTPAKTGCYAYTEELVGKNAAGDEIYHVHHKPGQPGYSDDQLFAAETPQGK